MCDSDELGRQVVKEFQYDTVLEDTMLKIVKTLSAAGRAKTMEGGEFKAKLEELEGMANDQIVFENLPEVRKLLLKVGRRKCRQLLRMTRRWMKNLRES
jgi:uncharacterized protein with von Willebrand factor type A (vWA) domain